MDIEISEERVAKEYRQDKIRPGHFGSPSICTKEDVAIIEGIAKRHTTT